MGSEKDGSSAARTRRILFFRTGGERFAVDVLSLEEVVVGMSWTPVPLAPKGVAGVINHRGRIFTILDFADFCGLDGGGSAGGSAVLFHRPDMSVGVTVATIEGIEQVPAGRFENLTQEDKDHTQDFIMGLLDFKGSLATVLNVEKLTEAIARMAERPQSDLNGD